jgi:hypothetical protein
MHQQDILPATTEPAEANLGIEIEDNLAALEEDLDAIIPVVVEDMGEA